MWINTPIVENKKFSFKDVFIVFYLDGYLNGNFDISKIYNPQFFGFFVCILESSFIVLFPDVPYKKLREQFPNSIEDGIFERQGPPILYCF